MRSTYMYADGVCARFFGWRQNVMGHARRGGTSPACISAEIARAWARAWGSAGQSFASGDFSARYSRIASDSQTWTSPSASAGTLSAREIAPTVPFDFGAFNQITRFADAKPATLI